MGRDFGVAGRQAGLERVGLERHDFELHFFVTAAVFLLDVRIVDRAGDPARDGGLELLAQQILADRFLEVGRRQRRALHLEQGPVAVFANELAVFLERGEVQDLGADFGVADAQAEAIGLGEHGLLVDQLPQHLLVDAELFQHLIRNIAALAAEHLHAAIELHGVVADGDRLAFDLGDRLSRHARSGASIEETGDIEHDERDAHEEQAPLEPALVAAHAIKHGHWLKSLRRGRFASSASTDTPATPEINE